MGLFGECIYKNLPFIDITIADVERIAKHHFPENEIYREGNKLFIKSNKLMDSRRYEFRANAEVTIEKSKLCFKTKLNKKTLLFYLFGFLLIAGLMILESYDSYETGLTYLVGNYRSGFMAIYGLKLLGIVTVYLIAFAFSLAYQLHRVTKFLVRTIFAALEIYKAE